jgi:hypothetical protein
LVVPAPIGPLKLLPPEDNDEFAPSIREGMARLSRKIERLTRDQFRVIQLLSGLRQVRVSGIAGSGKTLVAAEKAIRLAKAGLKTLFLCHNPLLATHVAGLTEGSGVHVENFCAWIAQVAGEQVPNRVGDWANHEEPSGGTLSRAFDQVIESGCAYDAVVVDEGQDFRDEWWPVVQAALVDQATGILYIFHDDRQALLPYRATYPFSDPVFELSRNCRNAGRVYTLIRCVQPGAPSPEDELSDLGSVHLALYEEGSEQAIIQQTVLPLFEASNGSGLVAILGGGVSFEASPFSGATIAIGNGSSWRNAVRHKFLSAMNKYDRRGVMFPPGGGQAVIDRLSRLSRETVPNEEDRQLVRDVASMFEVHSEIRQKLTKRPAFRTGLSWVTRDGELQLRRSWGEDSPLWSAEVVLHFQREDWDTGMPVPETVGFRPHYASTGQRREIPVYRIDEFKGLESDIVLLFFGCGVPVLNHELYVGASRARLMLSVLLEDRFSHSVPTAVWRFWDEQVNRPTSLSETGLPGRGNPDE